MKNTHLFRLLTGLFSLAVATPASAQTNGESEKLNALKKDAEVIYRDYHDNISELVHPKVLNVVLARMISSYLSSTGDLSLTRGFAVLDQADKRLFLGGTFTNRREKSDALSYIVQAGMKCNVEDDFAILFKEDIAQRDIGLGGKITILGPGKISMHTTAANNQKQKQKIHREYLSQKLRAEMEIKLRSSEEALDNLRKMGDTVQVEIKEDLYEETLEEYREKFIEKEADYIIQKKNYGFARNYWLSMEFYLPVTSSEYLFSTDMSNPVIYKELYKPHEAKAIGTYLRSNPKWGSYSANISLGAMLNNVVKTEAIKSFEYSQSLQQTGVDTLKLAQVNADKVYVGTYEEFWSYTAGAELTYFFPRKMNWLGLSASIEQIIGDVEAINWKLGVPISLKNEEGESKVNFELQWREQYKSHSLGIGVGLPLGGILY